MKAFLLAAGQGTRLRPLTNRIPKCLVSVKGKPLLRYWLRLDERCGIREILINLHHLPHIEDSFSITRGPLSAIDSGITASKCGIRKGRGVNLMITNCVVRVGFVILASLLLAALVSVPAHGATYYVATSGSDANAGTEAQPWRTIQKAAVTLIAGDTVYVKAGTYKERVVPKNSGNPGNYIAYIAYPGHTVTIDGTGISVPGWGGLFDVSGRSYIKVSGFRIINSPSAGIFAANSSHIIIEKNYTYNTFSSGIGIWDSDNIVIDGNEVELACNDGGNECITVAVTDTFEIKNNHVHHGGPGTLGGEGIDAKDGSSNGRIYKNHVHDINRLGIYVDAWNKHTYNIDVFQNIVHDSAGGAITLATERGGKLENVTVYNNIAYNMESNGFEIFPFSGEKKNFKIINNVFYNSRGGIRVRTREGENIVIRNNILSKNGNQIEAAAPDILTVDHNLIDGDTDIYGAHYVIGDPMFANPSGADFHLQEDSPAVDSGSSIDAPGEDFAGIPRPQGEGVDIGAFEFIGNGIDVPSNGKSLIIYLFQNYPNPFNTITNIKYLIAKTAHVDLKVYTLSGQLVKTLVDREQDLGGHVVEWDGRNDEGQKVSRGIYLYCLKAAGYTRVKKCVVSK